MCCCWTALPHLAKDCLPLPPTPTSMALPRGTLMVLAMRVTCSIACHSQHSQHGRMPQGSGAPLVRLCASDRELSEPHSQIARPLTGSKGIDMPPLPLSLTCTMLCLCNPAVPDPLHLPPDRQQPCTHLLEEHQLHGSVGLVVLAQLGGQHGAQSIVAAHGRVQGHILPRHEHEVAPQVGGCLHLGLRHGHQMGATSCRCCMALCMQWVRTLQHWQALSLA